MTLFATPIKLPWPDLPLGWPASAGLEGLFDGKSAPGTRPIPAGWRDQGFAGEQRHSGRLQKGRSCNDAPCSCAGAAPIKHEIVGSGPAGVVVNARLPQRPVAVAKRHDPICKISLGAALVAAEPGSAKN